MPLQLDLFEPEHMTALRTEVEKLRKSNDAVRKGLFGRHNSLEKYMTELRDRIDEQDKEIYKLKTRVYNSNQEETPKIMQMEGLG